MRPIDADRMCADLATVDPRYEYMVDWCIRVTKAQPTVVEFDDDITKVVVRGNEYVPVIRCKDCKHYADDACDRYADETLGYVHSTQADGFCWVAERKEE